MKPALLSLLAFAMLLLGNGCSSPDTHTSVTAVLDVHPDTQAQFRKVFYIPYDLEGNGWVLKRGTQVVFNADGTGELNTTIFAYEGLRLPNALQLEVLQFGPDNNKLFSVPGTDVGFALHFRKPMWDYIYRIPFGYKKAYFESITSCHFKGRLLKEPGLEPRSMAGKGAK